MKILFIDDDPDDEAFIINQFLEKTPFRAEFVLTKEQALYRLNQDSFKALFVDALMPADYGWDAARWLIANGVTVPIYIYSVFNEKNSAAEFKKHNVAVAGVVEKKKLPESLFEILKTLQGQ